ncbi:hypothetical protein [Saccharothrix longispora]|uniref:hypothetical protein n=1 Tax=Saccharothrix longispora TaxID=33920 RepID=UPI0028FD46E0|nr:hypothetical protein [Saccharothrix longispora]MDU0289883.1 hypothetical protein [Saccharothrix longispora]
MRRFITLPMSCAVAARVTRTDPSRACTRTSTKTAWQLSRPARSRTWNRWPCAVTTSFTGTPASGDAGSATARATTASRAARAARSTGPVTLAIVAEAADRLAGGSAVSPMTAVTARLLLTELLTRLAAAPPPAGARPADVVGRRSRTTGRRRW